MKIRTLLTAVLATATAAPFAGGEGRADDLRGLLFQNAKVPIYQRGNLEMVIFADTGERVGRLIKGQGVVLEMIRDNSDVDLIGDDWKLRPYQLGAEFNEVLDFWRRRITYCEGVMVSRTGEVDQPNNRASGEDRVYFRAPEVDLNGIGFEADFKRRTIRVNSDVEIVMRKDAASPARIFDGQPMPEKYEYATASGDSLLIDTARKQIMLIGEVRAQDNGMNISSERLTAFLTDRGQSNRERDNNGMRALLADGDVVLTDPNGNQIFSDHLLYDLNTGKATLNCDDGKVPRVLSRSGEEVSGDRIHYLQAEQQVMIDGNFLGVEKARQRRMSAEHGFLDLMKNVGKLDGKVELEDEAVRLTGPTMDFELSGSSGVSSSGVLGGSPAGSRQLERVIFPRTVRVVDKGRDGFTLDSDRGVYNRGENRMDLNGNVKLFNQSNRLDCNEMQVFISRDGSSGKQAVDRVLCTGGRVRLMSFDPVSGKAEGTLIADKAEFFEQKNQAIFTGNVKLSDDAGKLDCDRLELYLSSQGATADDRVIGVGSGRKLDHAVAIGRVHMVDPKSELWTDRMTIYFRPAAAGEKTASGMMNSGTSKMRKVICEGNTRGATSESGAAGAIFGALGERKSGGRRFSCDRLVSDFETDLTELFGKVAVRDDNTKLECDQMAIVSRRSVAPSTAEDIDADPFAIVDTESYAPSRVVINDRSDLDKIVCDQNVRITSRQEDGKLVRAEGDHGLYTVADKRFVITSDEPNLCRIRGDGRVQRCEKITYDLLKEKFIGSSRRGRAQYTEEDKEPIPDL